MKAASVRAARSHISSVHLAPCTPRTPIFLARLEEHGVGHDLNQLVHALALALSHRRQLVWLPPLSREQLPVTQPWHWLLDGTPLSALVELSSCHAQFLEPTHRERFSLVSRNSTPAAAALDLGLVQPNGQRAKGFPELETAVVQKFDYHRGRLDYIYHRIVPLRWQRLGLLWWFQVLTPFLVRVRPPLSQRLLRQPVICLPPSLTSVGSSTRWRVGLAAGQSLNCDEHPARCLSSPVFNSSGAVVSFDAGLHLRVGDACLGKTRLWSRRCITSLAEAVKILTENGVSGGLLFVSTDSESVIAQAASGAARPFEVCYVNSSRELYSSGVKSVILEEAARAHGQSLLDDALADAMLLAHSTTLAGTMQSSFSRLAMQLRSQPRATSYVSLDGREWCSQSSCRGYNRSSTSLRAERFRDQSGVG
jgi:hypothetical protein